MREHGWTQARLSDYLDDDLPPGERRRVEAHVELCPECRRVLRTLRRTLEGLMSLRMTAPREVAPGVIERLRGEM
jgi:anti-sigma factor RsiW